MPTLVAFALWVARSHGQDKDLANINLGISTVDYRDTSASVRLLDIKYKVPLYHKDKHFAVSTISYKNVALNHFPQSYIANVHGVSLQIAWLYRISGNRSFALFSQVGVFSDLSDLSGKDLRYSAGFRYRIKHSGKLSTGWGLAYARQFFGNQIIPFVDLDYKPSSNWSITGQFPIKPKVLYHFNNKLCAGLEITGDAASYRLSAFERNNEFIQINQWAGLVKLEYRFAPSWQLNVGIGRNFEQAYKRYADASGNSWTIITVPFGPKPSYIEKIGEKGINLQVGISLYP